MLEIIRKRKGLEQIYRKVAEKNNTTPKIVKREIKTAVKTAWKNKRKGSAIGQNQEIIFAKGRIPTNEELILHILLKLITE